MRCRLSRIFSVDAIVSIRSFVADSPSFLPAAIALYAAKKVLDRFDLMDKICNRTYIYNICWDDPAVDYQILNITPDDVVYQICSAGDIALDYATEGPSSPSKIGRATRAYVPDVRILKNDALTRMFIRRANERDRLSRASYKVSAGYVGPVASSHLGTTAASESPVSADYQALSSRSPQTLQNAQSSPL